MRIAAPTLTRRRLLRAAAVMSAASGVGQGFFGCAPQTNAPVTQRARGKAPPGPRYYVTIFLRGGIDSVYTVDPKSKSEVEANVDVPYETNAIVDTGAMPFGPHFAPLSRFAKQMAIVRGVQVRTANHETGAYQVVRMRTGTAPRAPSLMDILGHQRDGQPLASVGLGHLASFEHSPGALLLPTNQEGNTAIEEIDDLSDEDLELLASAFEKHLTQFPSHATGTAAVTRDHVAQTAAFFDRVKSVKRFTKKDWGTDNKDAASAAQDLQRAVWFLENDLTRGVMLKIQFDWDSHYRNADKQRRANEDFTGILARFLDELATKRNDHGTLAEQTVVVVGSELGRFPVINGNLGKDHFPECPYWFFGPNINGGHAFVPTGKRMEGQKVSLKTGAADANGDFVFLDDIGTTLLTMAGLEPSLYGYHGRPLDFLVRS
jgi:uncharacterized protein (DUF1501 family)